MGIHEYTWVYMPSTYVYACVYVCMCACACVLCACIRVCVIVQASLRCSLHDAELKQSQLALNHKESELEVCS